MLVVDDDHHVYFSFRSKHRVYFGMLRKLEERIVDLLDEDCRSKDLVRIL